MEFFVKSVMTNDERTTNDDDERAANFIYDKPSIDPRFPRLHKTRCDLIVVTSTK